jgi:hypothetical protein
MNSMHDLSYTFAPSKVAALFVPILHKVYMRHSMLMALHLISCLQHQASGQSSQTTDKDSHACCGDSTCSR